MGLNFSKNNNKIVKSWRLVYLTRFMAITGFQKNQCVAGGSASWIVFGWYQNRRNLSKVLPIFKNNPSYAGARDRWIAL